MLASDAWVCFTEEWSSSRTFKSTRFCTAQKLPTSSRANGTSDQRNVRVANRIPYLFAIAFWAASVRGRSKVRGGAPFSVTVTILRTKPAALCQATTVYLPGGTAGKTKRPSPLALTHHLVGLTTMVADMRSEE